MNALLMSSSWDMVLAARCRHRCAVRGRRPAALLVVLVIERSLRRMMRGGNTRWSPLVVHAARSARTAGAALR